MVKPKKEAKPTKEEVKVEEAGSDETVVKAEKETVESKEKKALDDFHYSKTLKRMVQKATNIQSIDLGDDKKYYTKISDKTIMASNFYSSVYMDQEFPAPKSPSELDKKHPKYTKQIKAWDMYTLGKEAFEEVEGNKQTLSNKGIAKAFGKLMLKNKVFDFDTYEMFSEIIDRKWNRL